LIIIETRPTRMQHRQTLEERKEGGDYIGKRK
jgi:hypothetical protein